MFLNFLIQFTPGQSALMWSDLFLVSPPTHIAFIEFMRGYNGIKVLKIMNDVEIPQQLKRLLMMMIEEAL